MIYNSTHFADYSSSIMLPKLIQVAPNLVIALFELMKLIPAKYTIKKALAEGKINPAYPVIETTSGTYGLGLAIVCQELNIPFIIVSDPVIDADLKNRLQDLGGHVQIISAKEDQLDVQTLRLQYLEDYLQSNKTAFWPSQYHNPINRDAYKDFGDYLLNNIGSCFTLVGAVGSGGSTCGTIERVRQVNSKINLVGVDTFGSVLFGLPKKERKLRGLGNSILPKNLIHEYFDQIHWLTAECAYKATRFLHSTKGLFCGPTTGAAYHVGNWIAKSKDEMVVVISADPGHRYISKVYNDNWLRDNNIDLSSDFNTPIEAQSLVNVQEPWAYYNWNRQTYKKVRAIND